MAEVSSYEPGTPSWIDLATSDFAAAKDFYMGLFGWTVQEMPSPEGPYGMFYKGEFAVAACYQMSAEMIANGIPSHWATYVTVASVDQTMAAVTDAGGTIVQPPHDVTGSGRMGAVQDPAAAVFALWEPKGHIGAQVVNEHGALVWNELQIYDRDAAASFYANVFGWTAVTGQVPTGEYTSFMLGEKPVAGMMQIQPDWGPVPPNWSVYLGADNVHAVCDYVTANGGRVEVPPMELPDIGIWALVQDPQGAYFYAMQGV